jgi:hypothetical protein
MLRFFLSLLSVVALVAPALAADTYVRPHVRKDGTYVQPHYRTSPDSTPNNNWSTIPNVNPHTGQPGTRQPDYSPRLSPSPNFTPQPFPQPRR